MEWMAAVTVGGLAGLGLWMLLDRNLKRVVLGIGVLGNAINLGVFTAGRLVGDGAAFTSVGAAAANPLPQALVLTAIVIGFGLFVFALALLKRTREQYGDRPTDAVSAVTEEPAPHWQAGQEEEEPGSEEQREPRP